MHNLKSIDEETPDNAQLWNHLPSNFPSPFKNIKAMEDQDDRGTATDWRRPESHMTTKWNEWTWTGSCVHKEHYWDKLGLWMGTVVVYMWW